MPRARRFIRDVTKRSDVGASSFVSKFHPPNGEIGDEESKKDFSIKQPSRVRAGNSRDENISRKETFARRRGIGAINKIPSAFG